jgi:hypothetical protein
MKSYANLLPAIADLENLWDAWLAARKGKRRTAMAAEFELDAERHIMSLRRQLTAQTYQPRRRAFP